jgi:Uma2 family endonuclease
MAEHTRQFRWIVTIKENLELLFAAQPDVFVAGDLFWYPVQGDNTIRQAPDTLVVFGRPKGDRGSYRQWEEGDIAPQVNDNPPPAAPPPAKGRRGRVHGSLI